MPKTKKVINIRGGNASGKTTCVREFINDHEDVEIQAIKVAGKKCEITVIDKGRYVVLGRYDKKNGGCDRYSGMEQVIDTIFAIIREYAPEVIIYEGIMYSTGSNMPTHLKNALKRFNYEWVGVCLRRDFKQVIELLEARNEGADYNIAGILNRHQGVHSSYLKLKALKLNVKEIDVTDYSLEKMKEIITNEIG